MLLRPAAILFAASVFLPALSPAQTSLPPLSVQQTKAIDTFVSSEMFRQRVPGLSIGIYSRGTILLAKGYGMANVELSVPVKPETIFQSGSVGKQFVSAAVMMLVEEGKVSLDDSITKYFPDAPESWKPILVKNLLSHTSGLAEYESGDRIKAGGAFYLRMDFTEDELVKKVEALPIENPPGDKWNYRNTNYLLLGILIHQVTGTPYADFLAQQIFKPLGMSSTRLISEADIIPNRAAGYQIVKGELKNQEWVSPTFNSTGDGTLYFNVLDLAKWDKALYTTRLLKQSSLDRIWTVFPLNDGKPNPAHYGFGWGISEQSGHKNISHGGAWQGFTCFISRYPDDALTVVVLTNLDAGHSDPGIIARLAVGTLIPALAPVKLVAIEDTQPTLAVTLRKFLDRLAAGDDIRDQTTPALTAQMPTERMKNIQAYLSTVLPDGTLTLVRRETQNGPLFSVYRLTKPGFETRLIVFGLSSDGKVAVFGTTPDRQYQ